MGVRNYVVVFWGITLSDSEMETVCSSEALILTYKMTIIPGRPVYEKVF